MPILHSFEENKIEYEDEDEVAIKMMGTRMDKESLEHNIYKNDITSMSGDGVRISPDGVANPDTVIFDEKKLGSS
ncbi:hypothetical protein Tco_0331504 [Tanacetum coccineum]